jgi:luciferase family oxidoreductase group 1
VTIPLSVLDLSPVGVGVAPSQAIRDSIALARTAEQLGYHRYWFAEHHNMASIATSAPEVLIAAAAAVTTSIRLGAGGIMVPNHAPLHVVEVFRTLEALAPGRIDLGLGRAPGTDPVASAALRRTDDVNAMLAELVAFERGGFATSHPFAKISPMPADVPCGTIWMLGSTLAGATIGAELGVPYAFAGHFAMRDAVDAIRTYKQRYRGTAAPYAMLGVTAVCADTDDEARRLAAPLRVAIVKNRTGRRAPIVTVDEALAYEFSPQEQAIADDFFLGAVIGSPATVAAGLRALADKTGADELMVTALLPDLAVRTRSLELIAEAMR